MSFTEVDYFLPFCEKIFNGNTLRAKSAIQLNYDCVRDSSINNNRFCEIFLELADYFETKIYDVNIVANHILYFYSDDLYSQKASLKLAKYFYSIYPSYNVRKLNEKDTFRRIDIIKAGASIGKYDSDTIPNAIGRFGLDKTNPIPVNGSRAIDYYISRLKTDEGFEIIPSRKRSVKYPDENFNYSIHAVTLKLAWIEDEIGTIYFETSANQMSTLAPEGYVIDEKYETIFPDINDECIEVIFKNGFDYKNQNPKYNFSKEDICGSKNFLDLENEQRITIHLYYWIKQLYYTNSKLFFNLIWKFKDSRKGKENSKTKYLESFLGVSFDETPKIEVTYNLFTCIIYCLDILTEKIEMAIEFRQTIEPNLKRVYNYTINEAHEYTSDEYVCIISKNIIEKHPDRFIFDKPGVNCNKDLYFDYIGLKIAFGRGIYDYEILHENMPLNKYGYGNLHDILDNWYNSKIQPTPKLPSRLAYYQMQIEKQEVAKLDLDTESINGTGSSYLGQFRKIGNSYVTYTFFTIFGVPIVYQDCIRVEKGLTVHPNHKLTKTSYKVIRKEKPMTSELARIYLSRWIVLGILVLILYLLSK